MMQQGKMQKGQLNSAGFSLLEVLIAIVILSIVSIPLLHSFVTTAKTNSDASRLLRATQTAEYLIEDTKYLTMKELTDKYSADSENSITVDEQGIYTFTVKNPEDMAAKLSEGSYVQMKLDPTLYSNANALNLSDFSTVSASDSGIYTMAEAYDRRVYEEYVSRNTIAVQMEPDSYTSKDFTFFKENLERTITLSIEKTGTVTNELGDTIILSKVNIDISYLLKNYTGILQTGDEQYTVTDAELFDNTLSNTKLNSVFLFYNPRYLSAIYHKGDKVVIENPDNVETTVYVVAQNGAEDENLKNQYLSETNGLQLTVQESPRASGFPESASAALTLRTNLNSGAPYSAKTGESADALCALTYQNQAGTLKATGSAARKVLHLGDETGKALETDQTVNRIYKVTVTVYDVAGKEIVTLDGTRLNEN